MSVKLCEGCHREDICEERLCKSSWQREWLCSWHNIRTAAKKKAARVVRREQPEEDKPISHRE